MNIRLISLLIVLALASASSNPPSASGLTLEDQLEALLVGNGSEYYTVEDDADNADDGEEDIPLNASVFFPSPVAEDTEIFLSPAATVITDVDETPVSLIGKTTTVESAELPSSTVTFTETETVSVPVTVYVTETSTQSILTFETVSVPVTITETQLATVTQPPETAIETVIVQQTITEKGEETVVTLPAETVTETIEVSTVDHVYETTTLVSTETVNLTETIVISTVEHVYETTTVTEPTIVTASVPTTMTETVSTTVTEILTEPTTLTETVTSTTLIDPLIITVTEPGQNQLIAPESGPVATIYNTVTMTFTVASLPTAAARFADPQKAQQYNSVYARAYKKESRRAKGQLARRRKQQRGRATSSSSDSSSSGNKSKRRGHARK